MSYSVLLILAFKNYTAQYSKEQEKYSKYLMLIVLLRVTFSSSICTFLSTVFMLLGVGSHIFVSQWVLKIYVISPTI